MAAPTGNEYYKIRSKHGRDTEYTPETLLEKANEYFQWCLDNPLMEAQIVKGSHVEETTLPTKDEKGKAQKIKSKSTMPYVIAELPKMRPFSLEGFCNYADIVINTFKNYEKLEVDADSTEEEKKKAKDFLIVTSHVRQIIENQQFEGAASGFLNANIIARKLGLADKQETKINTEQPLFGDN